MAVAAGIFRQYDIRGIVGRDLTTEAARAIGGAYAAYLRAKSGSGRIGAIAVGRDNRPSGPELRDALVDGLTKAGADVVDIGVVPTPLNYWSLHHLDVAGGIQITGSHNPPEYNGFKIVDRQGLDAWRRNSEALPDRAVGATSRAARERCRSEAVVDRYIDDIVRRVGKLSRRIKAVYDCGNGAGAIVAPDLFNKLGLTGGGRGLFCESDGTFPNHHPDPTVPENLEDLIAAVRKDGAEIGIAFDGDADRIGVVDETGEIVWGDRILILYARDVLARTGAGQPIIFDVKCSQALPDAIERAGGKPIMWKTGHSLIKDKMKETHAPLAGRDVGPHVLQRRLLRPRRRTLRRRPPAAHSRRLGEDRASAPRRCSELRVNARNPRRGSGREEVRPRRQGSGALPLAGTTSSTSTACACCSATVGA